ncbi:MAG: ABC transporter [uncultured bacterium (gcode 4)]|uniref:ABC transporter n=1 Tax=uncultured bacterium (gcode 4) TaxID=1234023 RepID=K2GTL0_9BACT|nr:MAG: ABC transporter [uncultured bacterium (gcode 4)]
MKSQENIIEMKNLYKSYYLENNEEVQVLKWIDLEIKKNEMVVIMGESGSGKSTLLNIIWFLHPLTSWEYYLEWDDISEIKDDDTLSFIRNKKIGFIFQQFYLLPRLNSLENVGLPGIYGWYTGLNRLEKSKDLLIKVWLKDKFYNRPGELSGWQQQRIAIARALINDPEIILADEPTWNLDSKTTLEIINLILDLKKQWKTIIIVTHTQEVAKYADRIIYLKDWKIVK